MKLTTPTRAAMTLTAGMVLLAATTMFAQQLAAPRPGDETTAKLVAEMITRYHVGQKKIDDEVSGLLLDRYLEQLDPQKLYFTQSDVEQLNRFRNELDDLVQKGDVKFAYSTFNLYLKRLEERVTLAQRLIDAEHDFSVDESIVTDRDALAWAASDEEVQERWRKRIKYDLLVLKLDDTPLDDARQRLHKRYDTLLKTARQTENFEVLEMYLSSLTHAFDPHSSYMSPETLEDFQIQMRLSLEGIGAALKMEDGYTVVASIVPGGAAAEDGRLKVNDKIIGVGQADGEITDVVEMKLNRVVRLIRGPKGTKVRLQVKRADGGEIKVYELERQTIALKSQEVRGEIINLRDRVPNGPDIRAGVIHIPSFYRDFEGARLGQNGFKSTVRDVEAVLEGFRKQGGVDVVVVDLRMNGGGALSEAIEVTGLFIDEGPVVQVKELDGDIKSHDDTASGVAYDGPLVVLCNRLSASASEIFAGAIKDYGRGIVIGDTTTHGKGTVQNVMPVARQLFRFLGQEDRGALKLTINQFYRVNGDSTQSRGVPSDIVLPSLIDHWDLGESFLDNALEFDRIKPAKHDAYGLVSADLISALRKESQQRISQDPKFAEIQREIEKYLARKERKTIPLNEETLRKEREEAKLTEEVEEKLIEQSQEEGPIFPDTAYNDEVLRITADYAGLVKQLKTAQN